MSIYFPNPYLILANINDVCIALPVRHLTANTQSEEHKEKDAVFSFLYYYCLYLDGEKQKQLENADMLDRTTKDLLPTNPHLPRLEEELKKLAQANCAYLSYLYVIVLFKLKKIEKGIKVAIETLSKAPMLWCLWLELASVIQNEEKLNQIIPIIPQHPYMTQFFKAHIFLELQRSEMSIEILRDLLELDFPRSLYIRSQIAVAFYNMRDFDESESVFESILQQDSTFLDKMDIYSNILYVKEDRVKLAHLAQVCSNVDRMRPESCCIIGNYFSLRGDHEKAIVYFQRSLKLNPGYLSAWTLMGHEFVEMKNTPAAIESYRRAVDINPRDYRAWYGLGQTYEVLRMPFYSLYYYEKAVQLRPNDSRMWCAMANCYESLKRTRDAIKCYEKALNGNENDTSALFRLAKLFSSINLDNMAVKYYHLFVENSETSDSKEVAEAYLYLALHYRDAKNYKESKLFATKLLEFSGSEKEEAKALLRELHIVAK